MKKIFLLLMLLPFMAQAQTPGPQPYLPALHVEGKHLYDENGNRVVLHGVMDTPSMYFNSNRWSGGYNATGATNCKNYFKRIFKLLTQREDGGYCNVFRLHMDPAWTNQSGTDFKAGFTQQDGKWYDPHGKEVSGEADIHNFNKKSYETYLKSVYVPLALDALKNGMYCVVRPCGVCPGYLEVGDYYNDYLMYVWDTFSKNDSILKYSGQISIELANEPVTLRASGGASSPRAKKDFFQPIVDKIRSNGFDGIIWVPGTGWQSSYEDYAQYPIEGVHIGYAVHNYTGWYGGSDEAYDKASNKQAYVNTYINQFRKQVPVVDTHPIIITEVDWSPKNSSSGHYNEHGEWVEGNFGTWATGSTSKWGVGYKALLDKCENISMTLSSTGCYLDIDKSLKLGKPYPAFKDAMEAAGLDPADGSGVACFDWYEKFLQVDHPYAAYQRRWTADNGSTFVNPILNGDFPDPDVIRVGDTYYMVSTTFYIFPGCTLLKSKDLVNWEYCANPLQQINNNDNYNLLNGKNHYSQGQWAASLNYHDGKFYIYFISYGKNGEDEGKNILLTAVNPEGQWDMQYMNEHYYDAGWLFDDGEQGDGYLYVACGINDIWVNKLNAKTLQKISSTKVISRPDSGLEGCHMYHIGDYYYIYATYGGTEGSQTIFRSKTPMGEYEECVKSKTDNNPNGRIFAGQHIHQGALVETQTGEWWTVLFKDAGAIGRVPYLEPVTWGEDGWPTLGKNGRDVSYTTSSPKFYKKPDVGQRHPITYLPTNDTFTDLSLGMQWGWNHNPDANAWSLLENPGHLRLHTTGISQTLDQARNSLTQRILGYSPEGIINATSSTLKKKYLPSYGTIKMNIANMAEGDVAGLAVFQDPYCYIGVKMVDGKKRIVYYRSYYTEYNWGAGREDIFEPVETLGDEVEGDLIFLRAVCNFNDNSCQLFYSTDNETYTSFGDGMKMRFTLKYFTGQRFFLFNYATQAAGGYVDIDWFSTEPEYSEEMFYGPGVLNTFTEEDATAKELKVSQTSFSLMPGSTADFTITCTMQSGLKSNVSTACTYTIANGEVCQVSGGTILGKEVGTTEVTATYTDPMGHEISTTFTVNVTIFPLAIGTFNPSLLGTGSYTLTSTGLGKFSGKKGTIGGWYYENGIDFSQRGKYLVVKLNSASLGKPAVRIYDSADIESDHYYSVEMGNQSQVAIDLEEAAKVIDLSHVYYVAFVEQPSSTTSTPSIIIKSLFFSQDGENEIETAIEEVGEPLVEAPVRVEYYGMDGRRLSGLRRGTCIVRRIYGDGHVEAAKIIKK